MGLLQCSLNLRLLPNFTFSPMPLFARLLPPPQSCKTHPITTNQAWTNQTLGAVCLGARLRQERRCCQGRLHINLLFPPQSPVTSTPSMSMSSFTLSADEPWHIPDWEAQVSAIPTPDQPKRRPFRGGERSAVMEPKNVHPTRANHVHSSYQKPHRGNPWSTSEMSAAVEAIRVEPARELTEAELQAAAEAKKIANKNKNEARKKARKQKQMVAQLGRVEKFKLTQRCLGLRPAEGEGTYSCLHHNRTAVNSLQRSSR